MKLLTSAYAAIDDIVFASPDERPALTAAYERRFAAYATAYRHDAFQTKDKTMTTPYKTVTIPARESHAGLYSRIVTLKWVCPVCGEARGEPFETLSFDGSLRLTVHAWRNPCGHADLYANVRKEADAMQNDSLPFDGPIQDASYDDEADLRKAEYGTHAYDGWDAMDEERVTAMMGAEAETRPDTHDGHVKPDSTFVGDTRDSRESEQTPVTKAVDAEVKTVKCPFCMNGWRYNVDAGFLCKNCNGTGRIPATDIVIATPKAKPAPAPKFAVGDTVTYGPWTGTVIEIDEYDTGHMRVLYLAEREEWLNDYQVKPVVKPAPASNPVIEALRKIDIDSLSPLEALTALGMLKRMAGKA